MITADQIVAHLVGDYILQSDWMAQEKTKNYLIAMLHAVLYTVPFAILLGHSRGVLLSVTPLVVIMATHLVIDHFRLARFISYAKNFMSPRNTWHTWKDCEGTGYAKDRPAWLAVWLMIITDNTVHLIINGLAIRYL